MASEPAPHTPALDTIAGLAEPHRRALYDYVSKQRTWVGREQAAAAVGIRRGIAAHHLDRLADDGLLEIDYQQLSAAPGPRFRASRQGVPPSTDRDRGQPPTPAL